MRWREFSILHARKMSWMIWAAECSNETVENKTLHPLRGEFYRRKHSHHSGGSIGTIALLFWNLLCWKNVAQEKGRTLFSPAIHGQVGGQNCSWGSGSFCDLRSSIFSTMFHHWSFRTEAVEMLRWRLKRNRWCWNQIQLAPAKAANSETVSVTLLVWPRSLKSLLRTL